LPIQQGSETMLLDRQRQLIGVNDPFVCILPYA